MQSSSITSNFDGRTMKKCKHEWNCELTDDDVLEMEYTHLLIRVRCSECGMSGTLDSEICWKEEQWEDMESMEY